MSLQKDVADFFDQYRDGEATRPSLSSAHKIVVAVSGGPDSLALLHLLATLHPISNLVVAHLNHGWRATAAAEAEFVRETAAAWGMACYVDQVDTVELARSQGLSLEEASRQARYQFLARVAGEVGALFIATGHNADDQAETVLMHFLRGSGLAGLRGILPVGPAPETESELTALRPLLGVSRREIEAYCQEQKLTPIEDTSNLDITFQRNRLRHDLLPLLAEYNPQIKGRLQNLAAVVAADYDLLAASGQEAWPLLLQSQGEAWLRLDRVAWLALPLSLRRYTLRRAVKQLRPWLRDVGFATIEQARQVAETGQVGAQSILPGGVRMTVGYETLEIAAEGAASPTTLPQLPDEHPISLTVPHRVMLAHGWLLAATWLEQVDLAAVEANRDPWLAFVDGRAAAEWVVRPRLPGERFQPLGMAGRSATVKEVMINRKVPASLRPLWPIVAVPEHLVWIVGHQLDERVRVTTVSQTILKLQVERIV